jgi:pimeloyl-ACP methyl ester carboxylesterase
MIFTGSPRLLHMACPVATSSRQRTGLTFTRPEGSLAGVNFRGENREIEAANSFGNTPVVFIHGLWLLPSSWVNWANFFKQAGYPPLAPD